MTNPLQKYFRQPKIYITLPSKGNYYHEGTFDGDPANVPIFAMTGMDELIMKTPDALFNGEASVKLIESCCPYIKNAKYVPSIDLDTLLAAIRISTFGEDITINHECTSCHSVSTYDISAQQIIEHYSNLPYNNKLQIDHDMLIFFRPLSYTEMTAYNIENFTLQKTLMQLSSAADLDKRQELLHQIYTGLSNIQSSIFVSSIEYIQIGEEIVNDPMYITEWLANCERKYYDQIKSHLEDIKQIWSMPKSRVKCNYCDHEDDTDIALDQSHFFA